MIANKGMIVISNGCCPSDQILFAMVGSDLK